MCQFIQYVTGLLLLAASIFTPAHAADLTSYSKLSTEQKKTWQRILLQEDAYFRPKNADYYLSNTSSPDLAKEFGLAEQYLRGTLPFKGAADAAPWCHFPARFAFVAKVIYGNYFTPDAFASCNLPLPALDNTLKASIIETLEPADSGEALFHMSLQVQGKRFYNVSALALNIGYGQDTGNQNATGTANQALRLLKAFGGDGKAGVGVDDNPNDVEQNKHGQQVYRVNLPPEQIYFLSLLAFETKHAKLPYGLLKGNCHAYLEHLFLAVLPEPSQHKRLFFGYMPRFMDAANTEQASPVFLADGFWPGPSDALNEMAKQLNWHDYAALQAFLADDVVPSAEALTQSRALRLAIGKAAEQKEEVLKTSPQVLALRDEYLASDLLAPQTEKIAQMPATVKNAVPIFNSHHPTAVKIGAANVAGSSRLNLELDVFNTMADRMQAAAPYGFALGKLEVQADEQGLIFDHFLAAQQNSVGAGCCGEQLYAFGVRNMTNIAIDIVNSPQRLSPKAWAFKPQLEVNYAKGWGTISRNGWSAQVLPNISLLSYGEYIDLNVRASIGWENDQFAISASKMGRIYGPNARRSTPDETMRAEYKVSPDTKLELNYQHVDTLGSVAGVGYVIAF